ncbi:hypothetical protein ACM46_00525 [Chryseobacterium angstadtii]|uniref:Lipoprotein n=1 Tax=Chryseobacterium angstadtii TaxID=558151 RepID=A0A0J7LAW3_9FLAO|nr:hypothetical protein [Chryseobacterium angstadtii]KMQ66085.1 hypothetical protein ACM46_00525 [Chryseobacterium angstadtii]
MKKILPFLFLAFVSLFIFSCDNNDDNTDSDTYSRMRDITGSFTNGNGYAFTQGININQTDVVLVYRAAGNAWQQIPKSVYLPNSGTLPTNRVFDYNFVFDSQNVQIRIDDENFNLGTEMTAAETNDYLNNQRFRLVLVPAQASKSANSVDYSDYNAVVKYYNLDDTNVKTTKVN